MICSEMELGISQNHEGILVLPADAPLGMPLSEYLGDAIIDLDVTPNRPDCLIGYRYRPGSSRLNRADRSIFPKSTMRKQKSR